MLAILDQDAHKITVCNLDGTSEGLTVYLNMKNSEQLLDYANFYVRISQDFERAIFCYGELNYLSEVRNGETYQQELRFLKKKMVQYILTVGNDFYIVCCKEYDKDLDVYSTRWQTKLKLFKLGIDRRIEPNCIRVFDTILYEGNSYLKTNSTIMILSARDQLVFFDKMEFYQHEIADWISGSGEKPRVHERLESMDGFASSFS
jgi:hypothetical protein